MGASLIFDRATEDVVDFGSDSTLDNIFAAGGTMMLWMYPTSRTTHPRIMGKGPTNTNSIQYLWMTTTLSGGTNTFYYHTDFSTTDGGWRAPDGTVVLNTWQHIAMTYDSSSTSNDPVFYKDGVSLSVTEYSTPAGSAVSDAAYPMKMGGNAGVGGNNRGFTGSQAYGRAYKRILSASEINESMHNPYAIVGSVGSWDLIDGTAAKDQSGNGNDGTVSGATASVIGPPVFFPNIGV